MIEQLTATMLEKARLDHEIQTQLTQGLIKGHTEVADLHSKLIDMIPVLAGATRTHGQHLVRPVSETCTELVQFADSAEPSIVTEADAEVIRGGSTMEVGEMAKFEVAKISEVNLKTGHCVLNLQGSECPIPGKITDPGLHVPDNAYTRALNQQTGFTVGAKAVKKDGNIVRLYISDVN